MTAYELRMSCCSSDVCSTDLFRDRQCEERSDEAIQRHRQIELRAGLLRRSFGLLAMTTLCSVSLDCHSRACGTDEIPHPHHAATGTADMSNIVSLKHRSEEHTSELQSLMRISYAVFCLKKKNKKNK